MPLRIHHCLVTAAACLVIIPASHAGTNTQNLRCTPAPKATPNPKEPTSKEEKEQARRQLMRIGKAVDKMAADLEEYGTITISSPLLTLPTKRLWFDLRNTADNYYTNARSEVAGRALAATAVAQSLGIGAQASVDLDQLNIAKALTSQIAPQLAANQDLETLKAKRAQLAYDQVMQQPLPATATDADRTQQQLNALNAKAAILKEDSGAKPATYPASTTENTPAPISAAGQTSSTTTVTQDNSKLAVSPTGTPIPGVYATTTTTTNTSNGTPSAVAPQVTAALIAATAIDATHTAIGAGGKAFLGTDLKLPDLDAVKAAESATSLQGLENFFHYPQEAMQFRDKTVMMGAVTVSVAPGWRTAKNFASEVILLNKYDWVPARRTTVARMVADPRLALPLREQLAADYQIPWSAPAIAAQADVAKLQNELTNARAEAEAAVAKLAAANDAASTARTRLKADLKTQSDNAKKRISEIKAGGKPAPAPIPAPAVKPSTPPTKVTPVPTTLSSPLATPQTKPSWRKMLGLSSPEKQSAPSAPPLEPLTPVPTEPPIPGLTPPDQDTPKTGDNATPVDPPITSPSTQTSSSDDEEIARLQKIVDAQARRENDELERQIEGWYKIIQTAQIQATTTETLLKTLATAEQNLAAARRAIAAASTDFNTLNFPDFGGSGPLGSDGPGGPWPQSEAPRDARDTKFIARGQKNRCLRGDIPVDLIYDADELANMAPLVSGISPLSQSDTLDLASEFRRQDQFALALALALRKQGASGSAQLFEQFVKNQKKDVETISTSATVASFSKGGGTVGFQIGPRLKALADPASRKNASGFVLERQAFPALLVYGIDAHDLYPRIEWSKCGLKVYEPKLFNTQHTYWKPLTYRFQGPKDWFNPFKAIWPPIWWEDAQKQTRLVDRTLRLHDSLWDAYETLPSGEDATLRQQDIWAEATALKERGKELKERYVGTYNDQWLPAEVLVPSAKLQPPDPPVIFKAPGIATIIPPPPAAAASGLVDLAIIGDRLDYVTEITVNPGEVIKVPTQEGTSKEGLKFVKSTGAIALTVQVLKEGTVNLGLHMAAGAYGAPPASGPEYIYTAPISFTIAKPAAAVKPEQPAVVVASHVPKVTATVSPIPVDVVIPKNAQGVLAIDSDKPALASLVIPGTDMDNVQDLTVVAQGNAVIKCPSKDGTDTTTGQSMKTTASQIALSVQVVKEGTVTFVLHVKDAAYPTPPTDGPYVKQQVIFNLKEKPAGAQNGLPESKVDSTALIDTPTLESLDATRPTPRGGWPRAIALSLPAKPVLPPAALPPAGSREAMNSAPKPIIRNRP